MRFRKTAMSLIVAVMVAASVFAQGVTETQSAVSAYTTDASPKYVFMFIGDGMSSPQTNAAQVYNGNNVSGAIELEKLTFTQFFKTHSGVIGMGVDKVTAGETIAEKVKQQLGWKVGIISSVTLNHATPAAYYAHIASRNDYYEIGEQMAASGFDYFAGGSLLENDGEALYEVLEDAGYTVTSDRDTILSLNADSGKVYAVSPELQDDGAMKYALDMDDDDITLAEFVRKGIDVLYNEKGFFLMCEGGKIDWAGHANDAVANISDTIALDEAVEVALEFAFQHPDETLIIVTGDHETGGMTIGYAATGYDTAFDIMKNQKMSFVAFDEYVANEKADGTFDFDRLMEMVEDEFGLTAPGTDNDVPALVMNEYEYARLQKAYEDDRSGNTDGYEESLLYGGYNPISITLTHIINNKAGIGWTSYAHTGLPVPVYAFGEGAEVFGGAYDNTEVAKKLFALCDVE